MLVFSAKLVYLRGIVYLLLELQVVLQYLRVFVVPVHDRLHQTGLFQLELRAELLYLRVSFFEGGVQLLDLFVVGLRLLLNPLLQLQLGLRLSRASLS